MGAFEECLSNFVKDFAYKNSVNHLINRGYTVDRIMREMQYPLSREEIEKMIEKTVESTVNKFAYGVDREVLKGKRERACQENGQKRNESRFNTLKSIVVFYSDRSLCDFIDKSHMLIPALIPYHL